MIRYLSFGNLKALWLRELSFKEIKDNDYVLWHYLMKISFNEEKNFVRGEKKGKITNNKHTYLFDETNKEIRDNFNLHNEKPVVYMREEMKIVHTRIMTINKDRRINKGRKKATVLVICKRKQKINQTYAHSQRYRKIVCCFFSFCVFFVFG